MATKSNVTKIRNVRPKKPKVTRKKNKHSPKKDIPLSYQIKQDLKQEGIIANVRLRPGGYNNTYLVFVDKSQKEKARQITRKYEDYERDIATGEILNGGNTYVFIQDFD